MLDSLELSDEVQPVRLICCAILGLGAITAMAADVYRSVDENGIVIYSDRPEGENTERVFIANGRPSVPTRNFADRRAGADQESTQPEVLNGEMTREPSDAERAEERARNCTIARERAERYAVSHRLFRNLPDGEREYLSNEEIDAARAKAQADVSNWCS